MDVSDYNRVERAMAYIAEHASRQPTLEDVAAHVCLSPFHFQRVFCRWAGTTPKRFLQAITLERGKRLLREPRALLEASHELGLSGSSRLHDHFVQLEAVTPGEFKNRGQGVTIEYGSHQTPFGDVFVAVTERGICKIAFVDNTDNTDNADNADSAENAAAIDAGAGNTDSAPGFNTANIDKQLNELKKDWPLSAIHRSSRATRYVVDALLASEPSTQRGPLSLHVTGTNFQVAVWRALLRIPFGSLASYSQIAAALGSPKATRAVGTAIGANPVALLIPCHRVIQRSGALGGYRWGITKKQMLQTWEFAQDREVQLTGVNPS